MCSGFQVIDVFLLLLCVFLLNGSTSIVVGLSPCTALLELLLAMSVCPSVHMEQFGSHWKNCHEILYFNIFRKSVEKIKISSKSDQNNGHFTQRPIRIFRHISLSSSKIKNASDKSCRENQNTHFMFNIFFFFEIRSVYVIKWENIVEPDRSKMTI